MNTISQQFLALGEEFIPRYKTSEEVIEEVMAGFDFEKVLVVMKALRWGYRGNPEPHIDALREAARTVLQTTLEEREEGVEHQMGGFSASWHPGDGVLLCFKVTSSFAYLEADAPAAGLNPV